MNRVYSYNKHKQLKGQVFKLYFQKQYLVYTTDNFFY